MIKVTIFRAVYQNTNYTTIHHNSLNFVMIFFANPCKIGIEFQVNKLSTPLCFFQFCIVFFEGRGNRWYRVLKENVRRTSSGLKRASRDMRGHGAPPTGSITFRIRNRIRNQRRIEVTTLCQCFDY